MRASVGQTPGGKPGPYPSICKRHLELPTTKRYGAGTEPRPAGPRHAQVEHIRKKVAKRNAQTEKVIYGGQKLTIDVMHIIVFGSVYQQIHTITMPFKKAVKVTANTSVRV